MPHFCNFISYNSELVNESSGIQVLSLLDALGLFLRIPSHILKKLSDKIVYLLHVFLVLFLLSGFLVCFWFVCLGGGGGGGGGYRYKNGNFDKASHTCVSALQS